MFDKEYSLLVARARVIIGADVLDQGMGRAPSNADKVGVLPHRCLDLGRRMWSSIVGHRLTCPINITTCRIRVNGMVARKQVSWLSN